MHISYLSISCSYYWLKKGRYLMFIVFDQKKYWKYSIWQDQINFLIHSLLGEAFKKIIHCKRIKYGYLYSRKTTRSKCVRFIFFGYDVEHRKYDDCILLENIENSIIKYKMGWYRRYSRKIIWEYFNIIAVKRRVSSQLWK